MQHQSKLLCCDRSCWIGTPRSTRGRKAWLADRCTSIDEDPHCNKTPSSMRVRYMSWRRDPQESWNDGCVVDLNESLPEP